MGGRPPLLINATELLRRPGLRRDIETSVTLAVLEVDDDRLRGDVHMVVVAESTLDHIDVRGTLRVAWVDACARCLRPLSDTIEIAVVDRYSSPDPDGLRPVDPEAFPIENGQLDLAPMVREELLLGVPDAPVCRDDCPGLCPVCGVDLQTGACDCETTVRDDRWAALDALREEPTS